MLFLKFLLVSGVARYFPPPHGLGAVVASTHGVRGGDPHIQSSVLVYRKRRSENIGRAKARGTCDEAKDLWFGSGISKARGVQDYVPHIIVALGAGPVSTA